MTNQPLSLAKQLELLRLEYEYEKEAFRRETAVMGINRKVRRGDCWFPVSVGRAYYNSLDRFVVEILREADDEAVADELVRAHALHLRDVLDARDRSIGRGRERRERCSAHRDERRRTELFP